MRYRTKQVEVEAEDYCDATGVREVKRWNIKVPKPDRPSVWHEISDALFRELFEEVPEHDG